MGLIVPSETIELTQFDGGFQPDPQPGALLENQWAELEGFVFDRDRKVRSQYATQRVGSGQGWVWVEGFVGSAQSYLVAMDTGGEVFYAIAPDDNAAFGTVNAVTWTSITTVDTDMRPTGLVLYDSADGVVNAIFVTKQGASEVNVFHENAAGTAIVHAEITDVYPDDATAVTDEYGQTGYESLDTDTTPTHNVAAMWGDFLVLGDVTVKVDASAALDATNDTRGRNALWVSEAGAYQTFNPATGITYVASQEATIVGILEIDLGLLVFTTVADRTYDGVLLLRGSPTSYEVVSLRAGIGPSVELAESTSIAQEGPNVTWWGEVGSAVFPGSEGGIWHTQGEGVDRLDHYGPDRYPADMTTDDWYVVGFRDQVILSRPDGVLALAVFEEAGAWTSLVCPDVGGTTCRPKYMTVVGGSCYWVEDQAGRMYRWAPERHAERGQIDGSDVTSTVSTRTVVNEQHSSLHWHRLGVVASSPQGTGEVATAVTRPTAFDDSSDGEHSVTLNESIGDRFRGTVPAHGPSIEASATVTFTGDVVIEALSWTVRSGRMLR